MLCEGGGPPSPSPQRMPARLWSHAAGGLSHHLVVILPWVTHEGAAEVCLPAAFLGGGGGGRPPLAQHTPRPCLCHSHAAHTGSAACHGLAELPACTAGKVVLLSANSMGAVPAGFEIVCMDRPFEIPVSLAAVTAYKRGDPVSEPERKYIEAFKAYACEIVAWLPDCVV